VATHADTVRHVQQAVTGCEATLGHLRAAHAEFDVVEQHLRAGFADTDHAAALGPSHEAADCAIAGAGHAVRQLRSELSAILARFQVGLTDPTGSPGTGPQSAPKPTSITNRHGDRYPPGAKKTDQLPARVTTPGQRPPMVGYAYIDGKDVGELTAGRLDPLVQQVRERLTDLGAPREVMGRIANHVEMKVAAMMVARQAKHGEVTINNATCGLVSSRRESCHYSLEPFLPRGSSLTVYGTTSDGQPFQQTYVGKASR
jgi:hypothetical protein